MLKAPREVLDLPVTNVTRHQNNDYTVSCIYSYYQNLSAYCKGY